MEKSNGKKLIVNLIASIVVFIVQICIGFWISPFVIERLGESAYGFITLATSFTEYVTLLTVAINSMASRFISIEYNKGNFKEANEYFSSVFWFNAILSIVIFITTICLVVNIDSIINVDSSLLRDVKVTFALTFGNLIISFIGTCYVSTTFVTNRMDINAYVQILSRIIKLFVIVSLFALLIPKIYYVSLANLLDTLIALFLYIYLKNRLTPNFNINIKYFRLDKLLTIAKSGFWMLLSNISSLFLNGMDILIANLMVSQAAMGRLSISKQLPIAVSSLLGYFSNIFTASFTQLVALKKKEELIGEVNFTFRVLGTFLTVPFAGIIVFGLDFLNLWLPHNIYKKGDIQEIYILMMLTLSNIIVNAYMYSLHSIYIAINKVKRYSIVIFICSIFSITVTIILTRFSNLGVYAIAGTSTVVLGFINLLWVPLYAEKVLCIKKFMFLKTIAKNYLALLLTSVFFWVIKFRLRFETWLNFFVSILIAAFLGYIVSFSFLLNKSEKYKLFRFIKRDFRGD